VSIDKIRVKCQFLTDNIVALPYVERLITNTRYIQFLYYARRPVTKTRYIQFLNSLENKN